MLDDVGTPREPVTRRAAEDLGVELITQFPVHIVLGVIEELAHKVVVARVGKHELRNRGDHTNRKLDFKGEALNLDALRCLIVRR